MDSHSKNSAPEGAQSQWQAKLSLILTGLGVLIALLTFNYGARVVNYLDCRAKLGGVAMFVILAFIYVPPGLGIPCAFLARRPANGRFLFLAARTLSITFFLILVLAVPIIMLSLTLNDGLSCSTL